MQLKVRIETEDTSCSTAGRVVHHTRLGVLAHTSLEEVGLAFHRDVLHELEWILNLGDANNEEMR